MYWYQGGSYVHTTSSSGHNSSGHSSSGRSYRDPSDSDIRYQPYNASSRNFSHTYRNNLTSNSYRYDRCYLNMKLNAMGWFSHSVLQWPYMGAANSCRPPPVRLKEPSQLASQTRMTSGQTVDSSKGNQKGENERAYTITLHIRLN